MISDQYIKIVRNSTVAEGIAVIGIGGAGIILGWSLAKTMVIIAGGAAIAGAAVGVVTAVIEHRKE